MTKCVTTAQTELEAVYSEQIAADDTTTSEPIHRGQTTTSDPPTPTLEDQELVEKAKNAANGDLFTDLWEGHWRKHTHRWNGDTQSEADQSLMNMLAFWTQKDRQQIIRLFRQSGLGQREKANRDDYVEQTADKAIRDTNQVYDPEYYVDGDKLPDDETAVATADGGRLKVSNPTVVRVVKALEELGEASTSEIGEHDIVDRSSDQVWRAIEYLEESDAVEWYRDGRYTTYSLLD